MVIASHCMVGTEPGLQTLWYHFWRGALLPSLYLLDVNEDSKDGV
ncbi:hypothetical protein RIEGSTA812A_PEG_1181 [invertebrate metagenome]|uniref:Uncharacterized protein n=1 Tax=invertebrate metagenome TaxID=1711999 RepID=A0A484HC22_9ZZZZ